MILSRDGKRLLPENCIKCDTPFDEINTGWRSSAGSSVRIRYCKNCNRIAAARVRARYSTPRGRVAAANPRPDCVRCGTPFDKDNTGYKTVKTAKGERTSRYCKHCNRRSGKKRELNFILRDLGRFEPSPEPVRVTVRRPQFFTHTRRVETCDCEPWSGQACEDCAALWACCVAENEMQEWAVAS